VIVISNGAKIDSPLAKPVKPFIVQSIDIVLPGLFNLSLHVGIVVFAPHPSELAVPAPAKVNVLAAGATVIESNVGFESITGPVHKEEDSLPA
jgi:hypothetical protein